MPFPNCRSGVIGLAIAGNPENDGHLSPWQEAVGHKNARPARKPGIAPTRRAGLNKSEQRHFLAQVIWTFKQGRIADHSAEAQQFGASGLNLVIAAIVFWNSTYIADAIAHLRAPVREAGPRA